MIAAWSRGQWALRAVAALGPVVALVATTPAGVAPSAWLVALVAGLSVAHARLPESMVGTLALGTVVLWWAVALHHHLTAWALVASAALLASHVAALVAGLGPDGLGVDPATVRLWVRRAAAAWLLTPAVWLVARLLRDGGEPAGAWEAGLVAAVVAVVVATLALGRQEAG